MIHDPMGFPNHHFCPGSIKGNGRCGRFKPYRERRAKNRVNVQPRVITVRIAPHLTLNAIEKPLNAAEAKGLLYRDHQIIKPTALGLRFLNDLQQMFLTD